MTAPPLLSPDTGLADWSLDNALKRHVAAALDYCEGDREWAASELGINRTTLGRWLNAWSRGQTARQATKGARLAEVA